MFDLQAGAAWEDEHRRNVEMMEQFKREQRRLDGLPDRTADEIEPADVEDLVGTHINLDSHGRPLSAPALPPGFDHPASGPSALDDGDDDLPLNFSSLHLHTAALADDDFEPVSWNAAGGSGSSSAGLNYIAPEAILSGGGQHPNQRGNMQLQPVRPIPTGMTPGMPQTQMPGYGLPNQTHGQPYGGPPVHMMPPGMEVPMYPGMPPPHLVQQHQYYAPPQMMVRPPSGPAMSDAAQLEELLMRAGDSPVSDRFPPYGAQPPLSSSNLEAQMFTGLHPPPLPEPASGDQHMNEHATAYVNGLLGLGGGAPPHSSYPPHGAYPPSGAYPPQGAYPPPGAYPPRGAYPPPGAYLPPGSYAQPQRPAGPSSMPGPALARQERGSFFSDAPQHRMDAAPAATASSGWQQPWSKPAAVSALSMDHPEVHADRSEDSPSEGSYGDDGSSDSDSSDDDGGHRGRGARRESEPEFGRRLFRMRWRSDKKRMSAEEINYVVRLHDRMVVSQQPFKEDFYYQMYAGMLAGDGARRDVHMPIFATSDEENRTVSSSQDGVLGKIPPASVRAPRAVLDLNPGLAVSRARLRVQSEEEWQRVAPTQTRNYPYYNLTLQIERAYKVLLDFEDCERLLATVELNDKQRSYLLVHRPRQIAQLLQLLMVHVQNVSDMARVCRSTLSAPFPRLTEDAVLIDICSVRKGVRLLVRVMRLLPNTEAFIVMVPLLRNLLAVSMLAARPSEHAAVLPELFGVLENIATGMELQYVASFVHIVVAYHSAEELEALLSLDLPCRFIITVLECGVPLYERARVLGRDPAVAGARTAAQAHDLWESAMLKFSGRLFPDVGRHPSEHFASPAYAERLRAAVLGVSSVLPAELRTAATAWATATAE